MTRFKLIVAAYLILIEDSKILLQRRQNTGYEDGNYSIPAGHLEDTESVTDCLIREIKEEMDLGSKIVKKLSDFRAKAVFDDAIVVLSAYLLELEKEIPGQGKINHIDPELEEYLFIGKNYKEKGIKLPPSLEEQVIPFCIEQGILNW